MALNTSEVGWVTYLKDKSRDRGKLCIIIVEDRGKESVALAAGSAVGLSNEGALPGLFLKDPGKRNPDSTPDKIDLGPWLS